MLRGNELKEAEAWLAQGADKGPESIKPANSVYCRKQEVCYTSTT